MKLKNKIVLGVLGQSLNYCLKQKFDCFIQQ